MQQPEELVYMRIKYGLADQRQCEVRRMQYSDKENEGLESTAEREILAFVGLLERKYISTDAEFRPLDLARKVQLLTLDVTSALASGKRFGCTDKDTDLYSFIKTTEDSMPVMMVLSLFPVLAKVIQPKLFRWLLPSEHGKVGLGAFIG